MDAEGGNTKLTWKINNSDKNCQVGDKFEIQRANNPDFNPSTLVGSIDFSINREVYEMLDESGNQNANGNNTTASAVTNNNHGDGISAKRTPSPRTFPIGKSFPPQPNASIGLTGRTKLELLEIERIEEQGGQS